MHMVSLIDLKRIYIYSIVTYEYLNTYNINRTCLNLDSQVEHKFYDRMHDKLLDFRTFRCGERVFRSSPRLGNIYNIHICTDSLISETLEVDVNCQYHTTENIHLITPVTPLGQSMGFHINPR